MEPALSIEKGDLAIEILSAPAAVPAGSTFTVSVLVQNRSGTSLKSCPPHPVHLSYHWLDAASGRTVLFDGDRTPLDPALAAGSQQRYSLNVRSLPQKNTYVLRTTLVQEYVRWLDAPPVEAFRDVSIEMT